MDECGAEDRTCLGEKETSAPVTKGEYMPKRHATGWGGAVAGSAGGTS
ncbi:hypothetical protein GCM10009799_18630 [Nocardiopsis rhodophaea]|uniref:Uncharacterized protein n=1 Tax=Nocardiopsis rhodophaea TaxID=280238 RepID=A0ABN2SUV4_9ACTN